MDVSYKSRVTTTTTTTTNWPENFEPASFEGDYSYAEIEKRMFQLMDEEDCRSIVDSSHRNPSENYRSVPVPPFSAVISRPPHGDFHRMSNVVRVPNYWRPPLPAINRSGSKSGGGTGVFIPLPQDRAGPTGKERSLKGRINKTSE